MRSSAATVRGPWARLCTDDFAATLRHPAFRHRADVRRRIDVAIHKLACALKFELVAHRSTYTRTGSVMRKVMTWVAAAVILSAAGSALAANQYDLSCKGTEQKETGKPATPWAETFRLDLDAKRWCRGDCRTAALIDSVTADEIGIANSRATSGGPAGTALSFSRTTGEVREYMNAGWSGSSFDIATGKCTRELFSGLPGAKF